MKFIKKNLYVYVYRLILGSTRSILTSRGSFFLFFYSEFGKKIIFYDSLIRFCFMLNFWISKNLFLNFFNDQIYIFESEE